MKQYTAVIVIILYLIVLGSGILFPCSPERLEKSKLFRVLRETGWINEGWGFPVAVKGVSRYNSDCRPSLTSDGKYLYFIRATGKRENILQ